MPIRSEWLSQKGSLALPAIGTSDPEWLLVEEGFTLTREHEVESLFAISNGLVGVRASLSESCRLSAPATFVAGIFDRQAGARPGLMPQPDWTSFVLNANGERLCVDSGGAIEHRRVLEMRRGLYFREWRYRDSVGRTTAVRELRFASLAERALMGRIVTVTPENYGGTLLVEAASASPRLFRSASGVTLAWAVADLLRDDAGERWLDAGEVQRLELDVEIGKTYRFERLVAVVKSQEGRVCLDAARCKLDEALEQGCARLIDAHCEAWQARWHASDLRVEGDSEAQRALRFAVYHLVGAANPDDDSVSIGARALTGEAYQGHVFWDTEIYMLPLYTLTWPEAARAQLMYRHRTLPAACEKARKLGYRGALYAWESADTGEEAAPRFVVGPEGNFIELLVSEQEQHISADVAYAVWSYFRATHDERFLLDAGAEILFETARFWASRVTLDAEGRYHIQRVIGPDEYHESVDDDAYTNGMAAYNLEIAAAATALLQERWAEHWDVLCRKLGLDETEPTEWRRIADAMYTGFDPQSQLIEQFAGYFQLEDIAPIPFEHRSAPMDVVLGRECVERSKIIKQPGVLLLMYLLWDRFTPEVREANFHYYERWSGHGSSLSPAIHAIVAARLGAVELAARYFRQAREIDLADNMGNAAGGVHAAALGGLWQAAVFGFAGVQLHAQAPKLRPNLPANWQKLVFSLKWLGQTYRASLPVPEDAQAAANPSADGEASR